MQTFLPYPSFIESARVLDNKRLGKQRVEALQILSTLKYGSRWRNHPAVRMWNGYDQSLVSYGMAICLEWKSRGFQDSCLNKILEYQSFNQSEEMPFWLGYEKFHLSHQSNLIRKNATHYRPFFSGVADNLEYWWPC